MNAPRIYLDHAATTPVRAEVVDAMLPYLGPAGFGNPSSLHSDGQNAKRALDSARETISNAIGCEFSEITFTSGGTEADNAAIVGMMLANRSRGNHLVTTHIEHEAVLRSCKFLETLGFEVTYLYPDEFGQVSVEDVADALTEQTVLVSIMHANNEVGTVQPVLEIGAMLRAKGIYFHTDAVQTFGQLAIDLQTTGADALSISAHKIYGPKGVGALYIRGGIALEPLLHGGGQERERRAGTENVAGIAGFDMAVRLMLQERDSLAARMAVLRDTMIARLKNLDPRFVLNGHPTERLPNNINISFRGIDADIFLLNLDIAGISASSGSACTSGSIEPSHVLEAMGLTDIRTRSAVRFTLGRTTTEAEIDRTVETIQEIVERLDIR